VISRKYTSLALWDQKYAGEIENGVGNFLFKKKKKTIAIFSPLKNARNLATKKFHT
jgi:hypothetical protein